MDGGKCHPWIWNNAEKFWLNLIAAKQDCSHFLISTVCAPIAGSLKGVKVGLDMSLKAFWMNIHWDIAQNTILGGSMVVLKLYGHDNTRLNKNKKVTIRYSKWLGGGKCHLWMWNNAENLWLKLLAAKKDWQNIINLFEDCSHSNKNARVSMNCLVLLSLLCAFLHQVWGCWEDN